MNQSSQDTTTTKSVTVSVKVLFFAKSHTESSTVATHNESLECFFCGYDTISASQKDGKAKNNKEYGDMRDLTQKYLGFAEYMPTRIAQELELLNIERGKKLTHTECSKVCDSGLVVQLVLMPFSYLRDYKTALL